MSPYVMLVVVFLNLTFLVRCCFEILILVIFIYKDVKIPGIITTLYDEGFKHVQRSVMVRSVY